MKGKTPTRVPGIFRVDSGRYWFKVGAKDPRTGKIRRREETVTGDLNDAVLRRIALKEEIAGGGPVEETAPTLSDFAQRWLARKVIEGRRPSTVDRYRSVLEAHILPALGDIILDEVRRDDIYELTRLWLEAGAAASTVNSRYAVLRNLFNEALEDDLIDRTPMRKVKDLSKPHVEDPGNALTAEELGRLLVELEEISPFWSAWAVVLAFTGARFGEASALEWRDVDYRKGVVRIVRAQWKGIAGPTKGKRSRVVPMDDVVASRLRRHRQWLIATQRPGVEKGLVFPSTVGGYMFTSSFRKPLHRALEAAGIAERFTQHGLRRTFNDLLRRDVELDPTSLRKMIGHESERLTDHYSRMRDEQRQAIRRLVDATTGRNDNNETKEVSNASD